MSGATTATVPAMLAEIQARPVKLELNNAGSWKTVARFDARDEVSADLAMGAAEMLLKLDPRSSWRIATTDPLPDVLMRLDSKVGEWRAAS